MKCYKVGCKWSIIKSKHSINQTRNDMKTYNVKITQSHDFTPDDINNLVVAAIEGGINYWCRKAEKKRNPDGSFFGIAKEDEDKIEFASDLIGYGGVLILHDAESNDKWELDVEKMLKGIQMHCMTRNIALTDLMDNHDADDADAIVQYATMGEIVFG